MITYSIQILDKLPQVLPPQTVPPFTNEEGAEVLLQMSFHNANDKIIEYLKTNKKTLIKDKIIPRVDRISYVFNADITEEKFEIADKQRIS